VSFLVSGGAAGPEGRVVRRGGWSIGVGWESVVLTCVVEQPIHPSLTRWLCRLVPSSC
jgi:hypothetical protein